MSVCVLSGDTKPLPESVLIYLRQGQVTFISRLFHKRSAINRQSLKITYQKFHGKSRWVIWTNAPRLVSFGRLMSLHAQNGAHYGRVSHAHFQLAACRWRCQCVWNIHYWYRVCPLEKYSHVYERITMWPKLDHSGKMWCHIFMFLVQHSCSFKQNKIFFMLLQ